MNSLLPRFMTKLNGRMPAAIRRFMRDEDAAIVAEAVIVLPLLLWAYIALYVYWDAFRAVNTLQKAAYTVADIVSRQQTGITSGYVTGAHRVLDYLIGEDTSSSFRMTSVTWSSTNNRFEVHWSRSTDSAVMPALTTTSLQDYAGEIPTMTPGDYVVIVEVRQPYVPTFNIGLTNRTFSEFIVTRPRFLPCIPMDNIPCPVT